jgi:hypothetical protein
MGSTFSGKGLGLSLLDLFSFLKKGQSLPGSWSIRDKMDQADPVGKLLLIAMCTGWLMVSMLVWPHIIVLFIIIFYLDHCNMGINP